MTQGGSFLPARLVVEKGVTERELPCHDRKVRTTSAQPHRDPDLQNALTGTDFKCLTSLYPLTVLGSNIDNFLNSFGQFRVEMAVAIKGQGAFFLTIRDNQRRIPQGTVYAVPYSSNERDGALDFASNGHNLQNRCGNEGDHNSAETTHERHFTANQDVA